MVSDLAAALDRWDGGSRSIPGQLDTILTAARERLAQLPEPCECQSQHPDVEVSHRFLKTACHGRGTVYPRAIVDRLTRIVGQEAVALAVLDALSEESL